MGSVLYMSEFVITSGQKYSFHCPTKLNRTIDAIAGLDIGIIICNITLHSDAPSSFAASISSSSTCIKYCLSKKMANAFVINGSI